VGGRRSGLDDVVATAATRFAVAFEHLQVLAVVVVERIAAFAALFAPRPPATSGT